MRDHGRGGLASPWPGALGRRLLTIPTVWVLAVVVFVLAPLALPLAAGFDLVTRRHGWPTTRMVAFAVTALWIETTSEIRLLWALATRAFRRTDRTHEDHHLIAWWVGRLVRGAERVCGIRFEVEGPADLGPGPLLVFAQHVSVVDAIYPAHLLENVHHRYVRYVLTRGLRFDPCLDIVGHRLPNWFVARGASDNAAELAALRTLATGMEGDEVAVIFPGGGLFTPERRARAAERLDELGAPQAGAAARLRNVMPPRPGGIHAFFEAGPDAHVLIVGHVGFEALASIKRLWQVLPVRQPIRIRVWRHERSEVPEDEQGRLDWMYERWAAMDDWIEEQQA